MIHIISFKQLKKQHSDINCTIIKLTRNFGQGPAIFAGYENAKGDCIINIAADLQDPVEIINEMLHIILRKSIKLFCLLEDQDTTHSLETLLQKYFIGLFEN